MARFGERGRQALKHYIRSFQGDGAGYLLLTARGDRNLNRSAIRTIFTPSVMQMLGSVGGAGSSIWRADCNRQVRIRAKTGVRTLSDGRVTPTLERRETESLEAVPGT